MESMIWTSQEVLTIALNFSTQVLLPTTANSFSKGWIFETKNMHLSYLIQVLHLLLLELINSSHMFGLVVLAYTSDIFWALSTLGSVIAQFRELNAVLLTKMFFSLAWSFCYVFKLVLSGFFFFFWFHLMMNVSCAYGLHCSSFQWFK